MKDCITKNMIREEVNRCWMCHAPVCSAACKSGMQPARMLRSLRLENEAGATRHARQMEGCLTCTARACEKACLRGRNGQAVKIHDIFSYLYKQGESSSEQKATDSLPTGKHSLPDLSLDFCGIRCENPFILASSPIAHNYEMCARALDAGWGGICFKTISYYPVEEVSPRFDQVQQGGVPFIGFKNMEQLSEAPIRTNFDILYRLKQHYPDKLIISSIMGRTEEEWTHLAHFSTLAGADIIECNFSCPQMTSEGMGCDVGQNPSLVRSFTAAACRGTHLPVIAKMTPNLTHIVPVARAACEGGATGIAAINTIKSITRIDEEAMTALPVINGKSSVSGYSGKAIRPIALRFIHELASDPIIGQAPLSGIGGIETWRDALDFLLLGCTNLQICTSVMQYGYRIIDDLREGLQLYMQRKGYTNLSQLIGLAVSNIVPPESLDRTTICRPVIDRELCIGCGRCYISCQDGGHQAIVFPLSRRPAIDEAQCVGCLLCSLVCPTGAIRQGERIGKVHS